MVGVAQLVRAPDCGSGGRGFDPHHSPHYYELVSYLIKVFFEFIVPADILLGRSQVGKARDFDSRTVGSSPAAPAIMTH